MAKSISSSSVLVVLAAAALSARDTDAGVTLEVGGQATFVLEEDGTLVGWGWSREVTGKDDDPVYGLHVGDFGSEMGSGLPRARSGKLANVTAIARGVTCLVDRSAPPSRALHCWGYCIDGRCGHGVRGHIVSIEDAPLTDLGSDTTDRVISAHGALEGHMCALFASGRVKCWGVNQVGQLGLGDRIYRGDQPGEMGDNLPFVDLGTDVKAVQLAVYQSDSCAVLEGRRLIKCWGGNYYLAQGGNETRGDEPGEMGDNLPAIDMGAGVEDIGMGTGFVCVLLAETREVKCWGLNDSGSLGAAHGDDVMVANASLPAVSVGGRVAKLAVGRWHSCVILEDDAATVKCWGDNYYGQLGLGLAILSTRGSVPSEWPAVAYGVPGETAVEISCGDYHTCMLLADGQVRCWGSNYDGQLGHGAVYVEWGMSPDHMGANLPSSRYLPTPDVLRIVTIVCAVLSVVSCALANGPVLYYWYCGGRNNANADADDVSSPSAAVAAKVKAEDSNL